MLERKHCVKREKFDSKISLTVGSNMYQTCFVNLFLNELSRHTKNVNLFLCQIYSLKAAVGNVKPFKVKLFPAKQYWKYCTVVVIIIIINMTAAA